MSKAESLQLTSLTNSNEEVPLLPVLKQFFFLLQSVLDALVTTSLNIFQYLSKAERLLLTSLTDSIEQGSFVSVLKQNC